MKYISRLLPLIVAVTVALGCVLPPSTVHASQGSVYFKPGSGTYTVNKSFTVQVWVDVQAQTPLYHTSKGSITFPSDLLQATKAVNSNSGADFALSIKQSQGRVNFNTMLWGNLSSGFQSHVFDITFKVKKAGTARLGIASGTIMFDGPTTVRQPTFKLKVPRCPSGQKGTWPNCYTPKPPATPKPKPKPTPTPTPTPPKPKPTPPKSSSTNSSNSSPKKPTQETGSEDIPPEDTSPLSEEGDETEDSDITDENSLSIGSVTSSANYASTEITWLTSLDSTATFAYGTSKDALNITSEVTTVEQKSYSTSLTNLKPGWTYYYQIDATGSSGYTSYSGQFQTKGYPVTLSILNGDSPLENATIAVGNDSTTYTTNDSGQVSLNLSEGDHDITIKTDNGEATETINVQALPIEEGTDPDTQNITVNTTLSSSNASQTNNSGAIAAGVILFILLILCAVGAVIFLKKRSSKASSPAEVQTFDDNFWSNVPGASNMTEDIYGNPVYQQAEPQQYTDPTYAASSYAEQDTNTGQYQFDPSTYQTADQYYSDMSAAQNPDSYGYTTEQFESSAGAYPQVDGYYDASSSQTGEQVAYQQPIDVYSATDTYGQAAPLDMSADPNYMQNNTADPSSQQYTV